EIAGELGVTGGAVRQLLNRARHTLRAGATAITPPGVLARLIESSDGSIAERVAQATAGAAGGGAVVKLAAGLVVAGAVVGGATQVAPSHHTHRSARHGGLAGRSSSGPDRDGGSSGSVAGSGLPEAVAFAPSRHGR